MPIMQRVVRQDQERQADMTSHTGHTALLPDAHRDLRILTGRSVALGDSVMSCLTAPAEFRNVQAHYPILFQRNLATGLFSALALFGFERGENLFLSDGGWDARALPLAMEIQPLLIGRPRHAGGEKQVHIDMASPRLSKDAGTRLFDDDGRPSPYLDAMAEKLGSLDMAHEASGAYFAALQRLDLLEPFSLEIELDDGSKNRLVGFHIVNEEALRALGGDDLAALNADGHLLPTFMAIASLSNLGSLIARKNRLLSDG